MILNQCILKEAAEGNFYTLILPLPLAEGLLTHVEFSAPYHEGSPSGGLPEGVGDLHICEAGIRPAGPSIG